MRSLTLLASLLLLAPWCCGKDDNDTPDAFSEAKGVPCGKLRLMLHSKRKLSKELVIAANHTLTGPSSMTDMEKSVQAQIIELFRNELDQFENGIFKSLSGLDRALKANFWSLPSIKANFKSRLEGLKSASLREEENYNAIVELEKKQDQAEQEHEKVVQRNLSRHEHMSHRSAAEKLIQDLVNGVVANVVAAADKVEDGMKKNQAFENVKQKEGAKLETVIKVEEDEEGVRRGSVKKGNHSKKASKDSLPQDDSDSNNEKKPGGMSMLIDSHGNKYILAESAKKMVTHHDWRLLTSLCLVVSSAFVLGVICHYISVPVLFGYVLSGVLIGPPGFNLIQSQVQVETLGEIGVYLLLFSVGLDFSMHQFKEVWLVAMCGGVSTTAAMQLASLLAGTMLHILPQQSCFVAACLTLSSTQLAMRVLAQHNARRSSLKPLSPSSSQFSLKTRKERLLDSSDGGVDLGDIGNGLFGILLMQDVFLALFVALLPILAEQIESSHNLKAHVVKHSLSGTVAMMPSSVSPTQVEVGEVIPPVSGLLHGIGMLGARTAALAVLCYIASLLLLPSLFRLFLLAGDKYDRIVCLTLGSLSMLVGSMALTHYIGISMELGCFVAGVLVSSQGPLITQQVLSSVEPIKHLFSAIFFVTIGFHVFPVFLIHELVVVMTLTTAVVLVKFSVTYIVISSMVTAPHKWIIGLASSSVAQVSECAFLVGSRGMRLGLISREVYLLLLSITTTSQLVAPVLWYSMSSWRSKSPVSRCFKLLSAIVTKAYHSCRLSK